MRVFLLHGLGRTVVSMALLAHRLERAGHRTTLFGYQVVTADLEAIGHRFVERVLRVLAEDAADGALLEYAVVAHSLGGVVTRLAATGLPPGFCRFVMLGVPSRSPAVARALRKNPVYRLVAGDAGQKLADPAFFERLPLPAVPSLVVAGTRGPRASWLPPGPEPNDGIVRVSETSIDGVPRVLVHGVHTFLMSRRDVFEAICAFLEGGDAGAALTAGAGGGGAASPSRSRGRGC